MSKTTWMGIAVAVLVALGANWYIGTMDFSQQAAVVTAPQIESALTITALKNDSQKVFAQIAIATTPLGTAPTREQIGQAGASINQANAMVRALIAKIQNANVNAKTTGSLTVDPKKIADLLAQISNAGSMASTAVKNATTTSSVAALKASGGQIVAAQSNLKIVAAQLQAILLSIGIK